MKSKHHQTETKEARNKTASKKSDSLLNIKKNPVPKMSIPIADEHGPDSTSHVFINQEVIERDAVGFISPKYRNEEENIKEQDEQVLDILEEPPTQINYDKINTKALPKHAKTYQLERFKKNAMIIFNHEHLEGFSRRRGTDQDTGALFETFSKFGFEITPHKDLTKVELFRELKKFSEKDFTDYGCVVVAILTHGTGNGLLRTTDSQLYSEMDVINQFKSRNKPTLVTKPIILLIQACRGKAATQGVATMQHWRVHRDHDEEVESYHLPVESDMLIVHSSFSGKPSFRPHTGTWFIQTLCKRIAELCPTHDFESIMTEVKREVAIEKYYMEFNPNTGEMDVNKQMPVVTSTLIRKLYLRKYKSYAPCLPRIKNINPESMDDSEPDTPMVEMERCSCLFNHFDYMKRCLRNFIQEYPKDTVAKRLLNIAEHESGVSNESAKATLTAMNEYLEKQCRKTKYHKYIYFYQDSDEIESDDCSQDCPENSLKSITNAWVKLCQSYYVRGFGTCIGVCLLYNFVRK